MTRRSVSLLVGLWLLVACDSSFAQALAGRSSAKPVPTTKLVGFLKAPSSERRAEALAVLDLATVQQPAVADALKDSIERDLRSKHVSPLTAQAARCLVLSSREQDREFVTKLVDTPDGRVALAVGEALAEQKSADVLPALVKLTQRKEFTQSYGFRRAVVDAIAQVPDKAAVELLIAVAGKSDGQLRFEAVQHLARMTGQNFGGHSEQWASWWRDQSDKFVVKANAVATAVVPETQPVARIPWPDELPEFFGVPIYAKRVVFVIDRSRSMASTVDGITRLKEAVTQLEGAVEKLDRYAYFNVIAYNSELLQFMPELVQAEDDKKRATRGFAYRLTPTKKTACYDALYAGLMADPNLEAMYFLSDGEPTAGRIVDMPTIVNSITAQNATQRTSIFTLGIDARGAHEEFLRELARRNGGTFTMVR